MLSFLIRRFIRDADQLTSPVVRRAYGTLCGALGIALNLLLFGGKLQAYTPEAVTLGENGFCVMV